MGEKVLAWIPLNLDGFLFSADYQSGKKSEIKSRVAANFIGWEKDHALFDREVQKVIRALQRFHGRQLTLLGTLERRVGHMDGLKKTFRPGFWFCRF